MAQNGQEASAAPCCPTGVPDKTERTFGMLCHLSAFCMFIVPFFGNILGPLILWLLKKDEYPFVDDQGKESLNFQITMTLAGFVCVLLMLVLVGIFLGLALLVLNVILVIIATVKANNGEAYRYPFCLRLIK